MECYAQEEVPFSQFLFVDIYEHLHLDNNGSPQSDTRRKKKQYLTFSLLLITCSYFHIHSLTRSSYAYWKQSYCEKYHHCYLTIYIRNFIWYRQQASDRNRKLTKSVFVHIYFILTHIYTYMHAHTHTIHFVWCRFASVAVAATVMWKWKSFSLSYRTLTCKKSATGESEGRKNPFMEIIFPFIHHDNVYIFFSSKKIVFSCYIHGTDFSKFFISSFSLFTCFWGWNEFKMSFLSNLCFILVFMAKLWS